MYRCPYCHDLSISSLSQISPPFNSNTKCPKCHAEVKLKRKFTNYLIIYYMFLRAVAGSVLPPEYFPHIFIDAIVILVLTVIQCRLAEYEVVRKPT